MSSTLTILGCGYVGTALAKSALAKDWNVSALTRNEETGKKLEGLGVRMWLFHDWIVMNGIAI